MPGVSNPPRPGDTTPLKIESLGLLVRRVRDGIVSEVERALSADGIALTHMQFRVIAWLGRSGSCGASKLAQGLEHDPGALTRVIEKLVSLGYVQREARADDRRVVSLSLTDSGIALWTRAYSHYERINARAVRGLTAVERKQLIDLLAHVADALEQGS